MQVRGKAEVGRRLCGLWGGSKGFGIRGSAEPPEKFPYGIRGLAGGTKSRNQGIRSREQSPALPLNRPTGPTRNKDGEKEN
jgi:hypothetical protein